MAEEAEAARLLDRLARCAEAVRAKGPDFVPRSFLLAPLEAVHGLLAGAPSALRPGGSPLTAALGDAAAACLLLLAALEEPAAPPGPAPAARQAAAWPLVALRVQARRLRVLEAPLRELANSARPLAHEPSWDAPGFFASGSLEGFWRRRFGKQPVAPASEIVEALAEGRSGEALGPAERQELRAWLRPDAAGGVAAPDAALALDGGGLWRGVLLCADWAELCPHALLRVVLADGRATAAPASGPVAPGGEEALAQEMLGELVLLPGWSRERLRGDRPALHALRALGLQLAADAPGGLLARLPTGHLLHSQPLRRALDELLGPGGLACQPAGSAELEARLAEVAARRLQLAGQRGQHVALSQVHRRALPRLEDDAEDLVGLQRQHRDLVRQHLLSTAGEEALPELEPAMVCEGPDPPTLRELIQEGRDAAEEVQACQEAQLQAELRRNAEGYEDELPEPLLRRLEAAAAFARHERLLLEELELGARRQEATRAELALLEEALVALETAFAISRRGMLQRDRELSQQIDEAEAELAALSASLAGAREASREQEDEVREARLELAEQMVLASPGLENGALEAQLVADVQALKLRSEELHRKLARSRPAAKKR